MLDPSQDASDLRCFVIRQMSALEWVMICMNDVDSSCARRTTLPPTDPRCICSTSLEQVSCQLDAYREGYWSDVSSYWPMEGDYGGTKEESLGG